ncbi:MAG: hypothetical protein COV07_02280 [Candidatus Vogelbacteria bacterium CG10_big_fil_rev_8_21_14_0_10_45_14]|uniref:Uncharacterized protein n=1 Tax=Candidatus Vogelbacteria bacterium CG10_big_fil_rev_8_21_14_0_10_45_14 TaxID=1975042 RepID=A0A2H0RLX4_9BACT|nr:MAG: hypothetical protein COV07_02280 [Candidatus Vogelbacteria bacterium CG10_big_fil_rev_8_21_14_0_10_45_14]
MFIRYQVHIESFANRHFIKSFAKKYKKVWDLTMSVLVEEFEKIDALLLRSIAEEITDGNADVVICKTEFKISGKQESRKASGNRCIVAKHKNINKVCVLLVYHKNDLGGGNETVNWKDLIKENYPEYGNLL